MAMDMVTSSTTNRTSITKKQLYTTTNFPNDPLENSSKEPTPTRRSNGRPRKGKNNRGMSRTKQGGIGLRKRRRRNKNRLITTEKLSACILFTWMFGMALFFYLQYLQSPDSEEIPEKKKDGLRGSSLTIGKDKAASVGLNENNTMFQKSFTEMKQYSTSPPSCITSDGATTLSNPNDIEYTLVLQLSEDRMWMMEQHCRRWGHSNPISAVIYTQRDLQSIMDELVTSFGCSREQLSSNDHSSSLSSNAGGGGGGRLQVYYHSNGHNEDYPINKMRNMALSAVKTTHVVFADVDFFLPDTAYQELSSKEVKSALAEDPKFAIVIPAFGLSNQCDNEWEKTESGYSPIDSKGDEEGEQQSYYDCHKMNLSQMPKSASDMREKDFNTKIEQFDKYNRGGQGTTNYSAWVKASVAHVKNDNNKQQHQTLLKDIPCFRSNRYEPYLVVRYCDLLPPFQEKFTGYGKNKVVWAMQLRRMGYRFKQIHKVFLIHFPHPRSKSRGEWDHKPEGMIGGMLPQDVEKRNKHHMDWMKYKRGQVDSLFVDFREWLDQEFDESNARTPICDTRKADLDRIYEDKKLWIDKDRKKQILRTDKNLA